MKFYSGVCVAKKTVVAELAAVDMDFSSARASGTNEEQFSSILQGLRDRRQCTSDGCARVPHVHVKDGVMCHVAVICGVFHHQEGRGRE